MNDSPLFKAVELLGGQTQLAAAATACGPKKVEQSHVWNWLNRDSKVPGEYAIAVAKATGFRVTPHELRPDLYPNQKDGIPPRFRLPKAS